MAKYENEGYCPYKNVDLSGDNRLVGLWSLIGYNIVYENKDDANYSPDTTTCDKVFSTDSIAYDVLSAIVKRNVNADKILVHQLHNSAYNMQCISDIQKTLAEVTNPQLIAHAKSNFIVIVADASYGIDLWIWDLTRCW